jgi:putative membrane protein
MRGFKEYLILYLKGIGMGAADVIPGVSGGTIAFISGIYDELISSIKSVNIKALKLLFTGRFSALFESVNGWFLLAVFGGVATSIFSLARLMKWLLLNHPIPVWSFFFGLILVSAGYVLRSAGKLKPTDWLSFVAGIVLSWFITTVTPASTPEAYWFIFISGAVGICAMILPGISGAFILLLMGKYLFIMTAVSELNIPVILIFMAGAVIGLILFSNLLSWLLKNFRTVTVSLLAGFMIGSLNKVWPWKIAETWITGSHGEMITVTEKNVTPGQFLEISGTSPSLTLAVAMFITGFVLLIVLETAGRKSGK